MIKQGPNVIVKGFSIEDQPYALYLTVSNLKHNLSREMISDLYVKHRLYDLKSITNPKFTFLRLKDMRLDDFVDQLACVAQNRSDFHFTGDI